MSNYKLAVEVVSANSLSDNLDRLNPCVELRFAGQSFTTSVKKKVRCPVWNESFHFSVVDRNYLFSHALEAYVYNVTDDSRYFLGKVRISGTTIVADSSDEVVKDYQLKGGIFQRSKGVLLLKVIAKNEPPVENLDALSGVNNLLSAVRTLTQDVLKSLHPKDAKLKEIEPSFEHGRIVEHMPFIFVRVLRARGLPDVDASGGLDPYVEVKLGDFRGTTNYLRKEQNPEWNTTFAFSKLKMDRNQLTRIYIIVNDKDMVEDEFVGMVFVDIIDIPKRSPFDKPLLPKWYNLVDKRGRRTEGELMLAIWSGSQTDEAFSDARNSDSFDVDIPTLSHISPKLYNSPNLWYIRIKIVEFKCIALSGGAKIVGVNAVVELGNQCLKTRKVMKPLANHVWNEQLMLVVAEPFEDDELRISIEAHFDSNKVKVIGQSHLSLGTFRRRVDHPPEPHWLDLDLPTDDDNGEDEFNVSSCRILICNHLEGANYIDDTIPAADQLSDSPVVGLLEVGILGADNLEPTRRRDGRSTLHPFCLAKYGRKWARTRTIINSCNPVFNEQYTWDVYDTATVLTIGVFDNDRIEETSSEENINLNLGKIRIRLSDLQPGRIYAHSYPLIILQPSGAKKMGELRLALRFKLTSVVNILHMYSSPILPKMHYKQSLSVPQNDSLRNHKLMIVAATLNKMEPPLSKEIVGYMCDRQDRFWSLRKSKVNFFRAMAVMSGFIGFCKWFGNVCSWKNPATTLLVHFIFAVALKFHELIVPSVLLIIFFVVVLRYKNRPKHPPHINIRLTMIEVTTPDELDEEYDTLPTSRDFDVVKMRYDKLRSISCLAQKFVGDVATMGERIQALTSWRDPIATAIFGIFILTAAIVCYFTPGKLLVAVVGIYTMRHPKFRQTTPSLLIKLFRRFPPRTEHLF